MVGRSIWSREWKSFELRFCKLSLDTSDAQFIVKLPEDMEFKVAAPLMCAGISIYGGIVKAGVPKGGTIGIVGIGGLGHIGTQVAKCMVSGFYRALTRLD